jgi:hypothetical protein
MTDRLSHGSTLRRAGPVVLLVIAASAVVAVGTTGNGLFEAASGAGGMRAVRMAGVCAAAIALWALLAQGRRLRSSGDLDTDHTGAALGSAALIMSVIALMAFFAPGRMSGGEEREARSMSEGSGEGGDAGPRMGLLPPSAGTGAAGSGAGRSRTRDSGVGSDGRPDLTENDAGGAGGGGGGIMGQAGNLLMLVLLFVAALLGFRMLTGRGVAEEGDGAREPPIAAADAAAGLAASLGEVAFDGDDPRGQITAAYRRLLSALAAAGVPREPQEAPYEYLYRVLGPLGVRAAPMHRLTGLYVAAQFSSHPMTEREREAAADALAEGLRSLRAAATNTGLPAGARA